MLNILLVGKAPGSLAGFVDDLSGRKAITVKRVGSAEEAWDCLHHGRIDVVITDEILADGDALNFIRALIKKYPLINCAMVSPLSSKDFHEATEGLGVFMQLPVNPGPDEAANMVRMLESIDALIGM